MCNKASSEILKFSSSSLFGIRDIIYGYDEFAIAEFLSKCKGIVVDQGFDFHVDSMQPGELDVIEFENGFEGLRCRKVFVHGVINERMG